MRFTCTKEHLDRALRYSAKALAKHSTLPIVQNVVFTAHDGVLECAATNLDVGVRIQMSGKIEEEGSVVVPPHLLASFIASVDGGAQIAVTRTSDAGIAVESGSSRATIKGFDPADFPPIPQREDTGNKIVVRSDVFRNIVSRVAVSVAKTEARPELTGVNMVFEDGVVRVAATDGFRLSEGRVAVEEMLCDKELSAIIVPASAIAEVLYILSDSGAKTMAMYVDEGQVFCEIDGVTIVSRLIAGTYPDYQQIIPQSTVADIVVARSECESVLRLADAFANNTTSDMQLAVDVEAGTCTIRAVSQDRGENVTTMDAVAHGEPQEIFLNTRYVLDGVSRCGSDQVRIAFSGPASPVVITPVMDGDDQGDFLYLVMPIRK